MRSLPRVIKYGGSTPKAAPVLIPDALPPPPVVLQEPGSEPEDGRISGLVSAEELEAQCERQLEQARFQSEELLQKAREETAQIRERAAREGYAAGAAQKAGELEACIRSVQEQMAHMEEDLDEFLERCQSGLTDLAVEIAEKVISSQISKDELVLTELVHRAVDSIKKSEWIRVEISDQFPRLLEQLRTELGGDGGQADVVARDLPPDACRIQMPDGILDASVSSQMENIRQALRPDKD